MSGGFARRGLSRASMLPSRPRQRSETQTDTFLLKLGTLSQNLDRTATSLFAGRATIGHFAGLGVVGTAETIADRAQAVNAIVSRERKALTDRLSGVSDPGARQRLLAAAQHRIAASISQTQLVELSEQAVVPNGIKVTARKTSP